MIKILRALLLLSLVSNASFASLFSDPEQSYAEEYKQLRILLENVKDIDTALLHKSAIEREIQILNQNQVAGGKHFDLLSEQEQKVFVKRFQQNRFHCGEVTQVMEQRRRILFMPELSEILADTLANIP